VELARARLEENRDGAHGLRRGTVVRAADLSVIDVQAQECASSCVRSRRRRGIASYGGAAVEVRRFVVGRAAQCGVQVARDATLDLHEGA